MAFAVKPGGISATMIFSPRSCTSYSKKSGSPDIVITIIEKYTSALLYIASKIPPSPRSPN